MKQCFGGCCTREADPGHPCQLLVRSTALPYCRLLGTSCIYIPDLGLPVIYHGTTGNLSQNYDAQAHTLLPC